MKIVWMLASVAALAACADNDAADVAANEAMTNDVVIEEPAADTSLALNGTTWEFTREGTAYVESIDADGNYIAETMDGEHADHGTYVTKDGKGCFTSAMTDEGEVCWSLSPHEVGASMDTTSDKGETLSVKRVEYREMAMPS
ncbi:hypothetical protein [Sphingomicrobium nitratireducens]|uniref:hypothetical protein n=1 Tax=Sphingomicrobium nitratireducens TaxID=2964666 RepID=UPI00223F2643|nr:hypothetical protein [Sphingomicrobium nitratireducens]